MDKESAVLSCKHFVMRKKRFCRMTVKKGLEYCGEHQPSTKLKQVAEDVNCEKGLRIDCPLDRKHTCFAHKLEKHLKVCNARPKPPEPHIVKGINSGSSDVNNVSDRQLSSVPIEKIRAVIDKINKIYNDLGNNISDLFLTHETVEKELLKPEYGDRTKKHLIQTSAILGLLKHYNLLRNDVTFVEFGAGKGQLSYWISLATESCQNSSVLLVERASLRHKLDNKLESSDVKRIRADIADLVLNKVQNVSTSVVGVTKHLCGDATDLAMRCLSNFRSNEGVVNGLVMSFCCHHRCQWSSYCGQQFFMKNDLSRHDFDIMCGLVSWAVCGTGHSRDTLKNNAENPKEIPISERDSVLGLKREEKEEIGRRCKMLLNWGRLEYLEQMGLSCKLHYYVQRDISLENVCIVAVNKIREEHLSL